MCGLAYPTHLNPVFILQKTAVKAMKFSGMKTPSLPLFIELQLLRLTYISNLQLASFVYECVSGLSPQFFQNYFTSLASKNSKVEFSTEQDGFSFQVQSSEIKLRDSSTVKQ